MEQSDCKIEICSKEPQRNLKGLLKEMTQGLNQATSIEVIMSGKGIPARHKFRNQLVQHMLSKLKKMTVAQAEGKASENDEEVAALAQCVHHYEELLWYQAHYDPLAKTKKMKKPQEWNNKEVSAVCSFLQEGIDFYLSLLEDLANSSCPEGETVRHVVTRCFVCLGDLTRYYCMDLPSGSSSPLRYCVPGLYYLQALELCPKNGLTHSNLAAVLCHVEREICPAVLHYLAALRCQHQQARVLLRPILEVSLRNYETLLDDSCMLVLGSDNHELSFPHTLLTVVQAFLLPSCEPDQLQIVCRNFLLHFDKLLKEICSGHSLPPAGHPQCDALVVQTSAMLGLTYHLQEDSREKTGAVLLASVLLSLLTYLTIACRRALGSCCSPAALAALVLPSRPSVSTTTSCSDLSSEPAAAAAAATATSTLPAPATHRKSTRRAPRRRRRIRRHPASREESSCEEDGADSDSSATTASLDFFDALCSSSDDEDEEEDDDGNESPDVIIESDSEDKSAPPVSEKMTRKVPNHGTSLPVGRKSPSESLPALTHLLLVAQLENVCDGVCTAGAGESRTTIVQGSAPGLLLSAKLVCSWLLSASAAKGNIVWCQEPVSPVDQPGLDNGANAELASDTKCELPESTNAEKNKNSECGVGASAGHCGRSASTETRENLSRESSLAARVTNDQPGHVSEAQAARVGGRDRSGGGEGVEIMWAALAAFCNIVSVDLQLLCSEEYCKDLPNLTPFLKSLAAAKAFSVDAWSELDNFTLPEDDLLRSVLPGVVTERVGKETPRALVGFLLDSLQKVGIQQSKDHVLPALDANSLANKKGTTSQLLPYSCLNEAEKTLLRTMRLRETVFQLTQFDGCPLEFDARTQAFYFVPDDATSLMPHGDPDKFQKNHNVCEEDDDPEGYYYVKGAANRNNRNKYAEGEHYRSHAGYERRSRPRPKRFQDGQKPPRKFRPRRQRHRDGVSNYEEARKSPVEKHELLRTRTPNLDQSAVGGGGRAGGKSYRQDRRVGRRTPELAVDNASNVQRQHLGRDKRSSFSVSSDDRTTDPKMLTFIGGTNNGSRNSPLLSSDDRNTSVGSRHGRFSREGSLMDRGTPSASSDEQGHGVKGNHLDGSKEQRSSPVPSVASDEEKTRKRQADQQLLTERWLRHELSKSAVFKLGTAGPTEMFTYIVPDALALAHYRPTLAALLKLGNAVVVPLQVLSHLDDLKRRMGAARDASRWLEHQVRRTLPGGRLRLQSSDEHKRVPGVQYPARQHKMPWRWYQILECCHFLARLHYAPESTKSRVVRSLYSDRMEASTSRPGTPKLSSRSDEDDQESLFNRTPVIMLLTGETTDAIGKLPFSLKSLTASVGTEMHFAGEMQKTLPFPPRRGRT